MARKSRFVSTQFAAIIDPKTGFATRDFARDLQAVGKVRTTSQVTTADASDLATVIALANDTKAKLNTLQAAYDDLWERQN